jgi:outer membrane protein
MKGFLFLALIVFSAGLKANQGTNQGTLQLRAAAFFPSSNVFRDVYGRAVGDYQIEAGMKVSCLWELWANMSEFKKRSSRHGCRSNCEVTNFSMGLKYIFPMNAKVLVYAGLGPVFGKVDLLQRSCGREGQRHRIKSAFGLVLKSGMRYTFYQTIFIDLFADYFYQPVHHQRLRDDRLRGVGGVKTGAGLGFAF